MPAESLLSESEVLLLGREMNELVLNPAGGAPALVARTAYKKPGLARIYSFAYQNEIVDLASPALFLVDGPGTKVSQSIADAGVAHKADWTASDLVYWAVQREDFTVRLDVMTGTIARILLDYELAEDGLQDLVRGGNGVGSPANLGGARGVRRRRWRSDDD